MMGQVSSPGAAACWPSAMVWPTWMRTRSPAASERATSSPASGSTPITRVCGERAAHTVAQPAMSPPPPTGTSNASSVLDVVEQLERDRALPGHHQGIVERVHEHHAALGGEFVDELLAILAVALVLDDLGAVALGGGALERRRVGGHEDDRARAAQARRQRHRLGVVARGDGADATLQLVGRQR